MSQIRVHTYAPVMTQRLPAETFWVKVMLSNVKTFFFVEPMITWSSVVHIYPVEPNLCDETRVTDSILGEYMVDENTSMY